MKTKNQSWRFTEEHLSEAFSGHVVVSSDLCSQHTNRDEGRRLSFDLEEIFTFSLGAEGLIVFQPR